MKIKEEIATRMRTFRAVVMLLLLTIGQAAVPAANAQTEVPFSMTDVGDNLKLTSGTIYETFDFDNFKFTFDIGNGSSTPTYYNYGTGEMRVYRYNTMTISTLDGSALTNIKFSVSEYGQKRFTSGITADSGSVKVEGADAWTVEWSGNAASVTFTVSGQYNDLGTDSTGTKASQFCFSEVTATYESESTPGSGDDDEETTTARIYVDDQSGWGTLAIYAFQNDADSMFGSWPGVLLSGTETINNVEYKYFDMPAWEGEQTIIFNNNAGGSQFDGPGDITSDKNRYFKINSTSWIEVDPYSSETPDFETCKIYVIDNSSWDSLLLYAWNINDGSELLGSWPGASSSGTEIINDIEYKYFEMSVNNATHGFIFNNDYSQLEDLYLVPNQNYYFEINGTTIEEIENPETFVDVAEPTFTPTTYRFDSAITVEILAAEGCTIYFTTDGSTPEIKDEHKYTAPLLLSGTTSFKAMAVDAAGNCSDVVSVTYTYTIHGIGEGYNPASPSEPNAPDESVYYNLYVVADPAKAYSFNSPYQYKEGDVCNLYAYNNGGWKFINWTIEGEVVSTSNSLSYVMPANDVMLVANYKYEFNPSSPSEPTVPAVSHPIVVRSMPKGACSFNVNSSFTMAEGETRNIYAYPNTGYKILKWFVNGEEQSAENGSGCTVTMGEKALDVLVTLQYVGPSSPANPNANYYNPTTGQLIIDDFKTGYLYSAINSIVDDTSNVSSIIVKGIMNSYDLGDIVWSFSNISTIDISRTSGIEEVGYYAFENSTASTIVLPSTVTSLSSYVFSGCENLSSLVCYAIAPPTCTSTTFSDFTNSANCTVYVPAESLELYTNADYWKNFTILPIMNDAHVLQVNLPEDCSDGRYKNNSLEIVNINTGVRQKYVISDRLLYTFNGLQKDEQYNVYLFSQVGLEIGRIENVTIPDEDIEVTFDSLRTLRTITAKVEAPDGTDVTADATVEWFKPLADETTVYLRKTVELGEVPVGQELICKVTLGQKLGSLYAAPEDLRFVVDATTAAYVVKLVPFRTITLSGIITDSENVGLSGANVAANQILNGKFSKSYTTKTDKTGKWTLDVYDAPETRLVYSATECINVNDTIAGFAAEVSTMDLGTVQLRSIVGARITYGFTYRAAGVDVAEAETYYSDYNNVDIKVFNVTQNREHSEISLQYPLIVVLDENVNVGDELRLTAVSKKKVFNDIEKTVTVDESERAEVTFDIVGKGGISSSFEMADNPSVIGMLYNAKGELLKKAVYSEAQLQFLELEDGTYTLVSMGQSDLMNSILRLANFSEIGLVEGKDYVMNKVEVKTGEMTTVAIPTIPLFDESLFYYTNSSASFTTNKSSITTGNYLTLNSKIDFKAVYKSGISNVSLVVDLPENSDLVEGSVIQGPNVIPYTFDSNRLTIQLGDKYTSQVRFCVIPTIGGEFNATASVVFDYDGRTITQPLGTAISEVKDLEIIVPSVIADPKFKVTGTALPNSEIKIYEDGTVLGTGKANSAGTWNVGCELSNPYNLSKHSIYAQITTLAGNTLTSETKTLTYDISALQVSKVTMINTAHTAASLDLYDYVTVFDFMNPQAQSPYWYWPSYPTFTFMVDFTANNPEKIKNVILYVHLSNNKIVRLTPTFNDKKGCWITQKDFNSNSLPVNVSVDFDYISEKYIDNEQLLSEYNSVTTLQEQIVSQNTAIDDIYSQIKEELKKDNVDFNVIDTLNTQLEALLGISISSSEDVEYDENELYNRLETFKQEYGIGSIEGLLESNLKSIDYNIPEDLSTGNILVSTCEGYDISVVSEDSTYVKLKVSGDKLIYTKATENAYIILDFVEDICYNISIDSDTEPNSAPAMYATASANDVSQIQKHSNTIGEKIKAANELLNKLLGAIDEVVQHIDGGFKFAQDGYVSAWIQLQKLKRLQQAGENISPIRISLLEITCDGWEAELKTLKGLKSALTNFRAQVLGKLFGAFGVISNFVDCKNDLDKFINLYYSVPQPCENDQAKADNIRKSIRNAGIAAGFYYVANITADVCALFGIGPSVAAAPASGGSSLVVALAAVGKIALSYGINALYRYSCDSFINLKQIEISLLQCNKKDCGEPGQPACPDPTPNQSNPSGNKGGDNYGGTHKSGCPDIGYVQDPSGYVYEAVPSNRVEGVQATIYYKETVEDMYGDLYENIVLWNAEEYAQENPLFTDENGMYRWDVPQGLWQVKFEKDGYQTAYSDWLPVPPPQLDVNVAISQNRQPEIVEARAYETGVEVQFDKYMDPSTLTTSNIYVTAAGEKVAGEIVFIDSEVADAYIEEEDVTDDTQRYASRVRFVPEQSLSMSAGEIRLTVNRNVLSYVGIPMTETYTQVLDIEKEVQSIVADDVKVLYGDTKEVTVYALPYDAAVGRTLRISNSSDLIATIDANEFTLDDEGKAVVIVTGELPGQSQLSFSIDDVTVTGSAIVDVVTEIITAEAPIASRASGTAVYRGTKIELTTDSKNAEIYFTTDGSCPCDENGTRRKYTVPIVIDGDTEILAMTSVGDSDDDVSEVASFKYTLKRTELDLQMEEGWTWVSHNLESEVAPSDLTSVDNIESIRGQSQEVVKDPEFGFIGTLTALSPTESYKVETSASGVKVRLSDVAWNPSTPININAGWNWIGYPVGQTMTVAEAFAPTAVEAMDYIVGQTGFAQYDGENWVGTLQTLTPGVGYMYQSVSDKTIVYNTSIVSKAASQNAAGISQNLPVAVDIYKYPQIMSVVAELVDADEMPVDVTDYYLMAFCGSECRGVGKVVNDMFMMNVYGNSGDEISFRVMAADSEETYNSSEKETFAETMLGNVKEPFKIHISDLNGISDIDYSGGLKVYVSERMLHIKGVDSENIESVVMFNVDGAKTLSVKTVSESGVSVEHLASGTYVVVVKANSSYTYHKVIIR